MKGRIFKAFLLACAMVLCITSVSACNNVSAPTQPQKLTTPVVVLTDNQATWGADANADKFEISLNGNLSYVENTVTSKILANGQTFKIRAIGDGINYSNSDWSNSVSYTDGQPAPQPTKLGTPVVRISNTGVASWGAVTNASGYAYKINSGAETQTTQTSVQLSDGQSIVVKAIGDKTNYADSEYSVEKTYTAGQPQPTNAPIYLGILASNEQPLENDVPNGIENSAYARSFTNSATLTETLKAYLENSDNALGDQFPAESGYGVFSSIGATVYIQIWLDNPDQNTILSLKLNGVKYQSGGALQSFFIANGNSYLNCVYVAVTIPENSYEEISYEVTEIEYVEGTNISQDGKAVFIDEDNDTVKIGLPYNKSLPIVTIESANKQPSKITLSINVQDEDGYVETVGGWLRVIIFDGNNNILRQHKLSAGDNEISFGNLSAQTYYGVMAFILCDSHDGNGVFAHSLARENYITEGVVTCQVQSEILLNEQTGKYYPNIKVDAQLGDTSFEFTKIEVCEWDTVCYSSEFNGSIDITENILNNKSYTVKIYYENSLGVEQSCSEHVYVECLDYPWILEPCLQYGLVDDAILGFDFGDNKSNYENLTIRIIDEYSKQYLAESAIYLIDNPSAIEDLRSQWQSMGRDNPDFAAIYDRWYKLDQAQTKINDYYPDVDKTEWQTELDKGIYAYEYVCGEDEEFFKVGNKYYVVLDGYQSQRINEYSWKYTLSADFDLNDGEGVEQGRTIIDGWFDIEPAISARDYLFEEEFTLDENGVVYLETKSRNNLGNESYRALGYVNQIVLARGYDVIKVLWSQDKPEHAIDESAWLTDVKNALIAGEDYNSVFPLGELEAITFDLDDIQFDSNLIGTYQIRFTYIMYGKEYTDEKPYDWDGSTIDYTIEGALPKVTVGFPNNGEDFGRWEITAPDWVKNGVWNFKFTIEIRDENQQLVGTYNQDDFGEYERLQLNYSIRIRLDSCVGEDYYTQGEWSDWFTCLPIKLSAPENFTQSYDVDGVRVGWNWVDGAEKYVYMVNDGEEQETYETVILGLKNGDTVKVKAVPTIESNYAESAYSDIYAITDTRTKLTTPTNIFVKDKTLTWDEVDGATYYEIEYIRNGTPNQIRVNYSGYHAIVGVTYRIRACNEDVQNYKASEWSESFTYTVTLENPTFYQIRRERVYWNSVEYANGYNYRIGENGEVNTTRSTYLALSDIPIGEKLYVQAYATGCENTDWVMIYHNVV